MLYIKSFKNLKLLMGCMNYKTLSCAELGEDVNRGDVLEQEVLDNIVKNIEERPQRALEESLFQGRRQDLPDVESLDSDCC
jgi:hypothetical protein